MTHKEKLLALLAEFGLEPHEPYGEDPGTSVFLTSGYGKVDGYTGFFAEFGFNEDGTFTGMGVWE